MFNLLSLVFLLAITTTVVAEPVIYVCERPAWDSVKGCGPNNTYYTYAFYTDTEVVRNDIQADKKSFRYQKPEYVFAMRKGCDLNNARPKVEKFEATDNEIRFGFAQMYSQSVSAYETAKLDLETMTARLQKVKHNPELNCTAFIGEKMIASQDNLADFWNALSSLPPPRTGVTRHQQSIQ
ncbi:MAG: hypothetical protein V2I48_12675 [Xanthomonadales bacterium]|jgi:hypothetical protein|nr:hypothetical protein [Xanthomonadales bacterium]